MGHTRCECENVHWREKIGPTALSWDVVDRKTCPFCLTNKSRLMYVQQIILANTNRNLIIQLVALNIQQI